MALGSLTTAAAASGPYLENYMFPFDETHLVLFPVSL